MALGNNYFVFIGPNRPLPDIKCIQDYLNIVYMVKDTGLPNYRGARLPIASDLHTDTCERHLQGYPNTSLLHYLKFDFPLSLRKPHNFAISEAKNHFSAVSCILGSFNISLDHGIHSSTRLTRPKGINKCRVILDLSYPYKGLWFMTKLRD